MFHRDPMVDVDNGGMPPRMMWEVYDDIEKLPEASQNGMIDLVNTMDRDFWDKPRKEQVLDLVVNMDGYNVTQKDIAKPMKVSESSVTRIKHYHHDRPNNEFRPVGRPSPIGAVFLAVIDFICGELHEQRSVTMAVLHEYLADQHNVFVERASPLQFMRNQGLCLRLSIANRGRPSGR